MNSRAEGSFLHKRRIVCITNNIHFGVTMKSVSGSLSLSSDVLAFLRPNTYFKRLITLPVMQKISGKIKNGPLGKFHPTPSQKKYIKIGAVIAVILAGRGLYHLLWTESTDDSFVKAHVHVVSSRIVGTVQEVLVNDNQMVKKGDVLVKLDPRDYEVQVKAAQAGYSKTHKDLGRFQGYTNLGPTEKPVFDQYEATAL